MLGSKTSLHWCGGAMPVQLEDTRQVGPSVHSYGSPTHTPSLHVSECVHEMPSSQGRGRAGTHSVVCRVTSHTMQVLLGCVVPCGQHWVSIRQPHWLSQMAPVHSGSCTHLSPSQICVAIQGGG